LNVRLKILNGPMAGTKYSIDEQMVCLVGRGKDCTIRIPPEADGKISRHHCLINATPLHVTIEDLHSSNGTYIGDRHLHGVSPSDFCVLQGGETILLGNTQIQVDVRGREKLSVPKLSKCSKCGSDLDIVPFAFEPTDPPLCRKCAGSPETAILERIGKDCPITGCSIVREIGRRAGGLTMLIERDNDGCLFALKLMVPGNTYDPNLKSRFITECSTASQLKHRNIVKVFDAGTYKGILHLLMEFCNGGTLEHAVKAKGGAIGTAEAISHAMQLLDGLEYAHTLKLKNRTGILHLDLRPENILIVREPDDTMTPKISCFGLASAFSMASVAGMPAGISSTSFISRQQLIMNRDSGPEADVWSMAALLFYMLTGKPPRDVKGESNPVKTVLERGCIPLHEVRPDLDKALCGIVDQALDDRKPLPFRTAAELREKLIPFAGK